MSSDSAISATTVPPGSTATHVSWWGRARPRASAGRRHPDGRARNRTWRARMPAIRRRCLPRRRVRRAGSRSRPRIVGWRRSPDRPSARWQAGGRRLVQDPRGSLAARELCGPAVRVHSGPKMSARIAVLPAPCITTRICRATARIAGLRVTRSTCGSMCVGAGIASAQSFDSKAAERGTRKAHARRHRPRATRDRAPAAVDDLEAGGTQLSLELRGAADRAPALPDRLVRPEWVDVREGQGNTRRVAADGAARLMACQVEQDVVERLDVGQGWSRGTKRSSPHQTWTFGHGMSFACSGWRGAGRCRPEWSRRWSPSRPGRAPRRRPAASRRSAPRQVPTQPPRRRRR